MIDISTAQLDPYRGFHFFHEEVNIYVKVSLSAALLLIRQTANPKDSDELHDLIRLTHPSWNTPPIREMSLDLQRRTYGSISAFSLISIFSAFDDFIVGTSAELHRYYSSGPGKQPVKLVGAKVPIQVETSHQNDDDDDDSEERLRAFFDKNGWDSAAIVPLLPIVRYFRLCRNCIAHRNGRASRALVKCAADDEIHKQIKVLLDTSSDGLKKYSINDYVFIEPTQAILCSHLLRRIAQHANGQLLNTLGLDGFLRSVAHHTMFADQIARTDAAKTAESVLNTSLTNRYRAKVSDSKVGIQEMKRLGLWKRYLEEFNRKYVI